jgi:tetratricopeptide (TPR) repeat protein
LNWAYKTDIEAGLYLAGHLRRYWESANVREGIHWLENFIHHPGSMGFPAGRAQALQTYGWLLTWFQQFERARIATEEGLALFRSAGDRRGEADTLVSLANIWQFLDDPDSALELLHQSLALARSLNDPWREANVYHLLGWHRRDSRRTVMYWEKAVSLYRETDDEIALADLLSLLGQFRILEGDIAQGKKLLDEAIVLWEANNRANIWENVKIAQSVLALLQGENDTAYELLEQAFQSARERGNRMSSLWVRVRMGDAALRAGHLEEAYDILAETARDFKKDGYTIGCAVALEGIANYCVVTGKPDRAARLIGWADAIRKQFGDPRRGIEQADIDKLISACLASMGEIAFSDAYDEGGKMQLDEAVEYALNG